MAFNQSERDEVTELADDLKDALSVRVDPQVDDMFKAFKYQMLVKDLDEFIEYAPSGSNTGIINRAKRLFSRYVSLMGSFVRDNDNRVFYTRTWREFIQFMAFVEANNDN